MESTMANGLFAMMVNAAKTGCGRGAVVFNIGRMSIYLNQRRIDEDEETD